MNVSITTSPDKMEAYIKITDRLPEEVVELEKIMEAIRNAKIVHGIDYDALKFLCSSPVDNSPVLFAHGDLPKDGEDGRIVFEITESTTSKTTSGNRVDFREFPVQKRIIVKSGQKIASILPPTEGVPGKNVYGEPMPAKRGNEAKAVLGKNVAVSEDGSSIIATTEGILRVDLEKGTIEVSEYLEIEGDIDYNTGNVEFPGVILVKGDVKPGFIVRAKSDIEVNGIVEAATVISLEGNVRISGVKGKDKGLIKAKKNVHVKYAEAVTIEAENLYFETNLLNCTVRVTNSIIGNRGRSAIMGGECVAAIKIEADEIGSNFGINTYLEVGINPYIREEIKLLRAQIEIDKASIQKLISIVRQYKNLKEKGAEIPPEREEQFSKTTKTLINLRNQLETNLAKLNELEERVQKMRFDSQIIARKMLYQGVEVVIYNSRYYAEIPLQKVVLKYDGEKIVAGGYAG
ncbi:MAG: FapA family protein [Fervidobacterium sp.]